MHTELGHVVTKAQCIFNKVTWSCHLTGRSLPHTGNTERHHSSHSDHHIEHTSWTTCPQTSSQDTSCNSSISACRNTPSLILYIISTSIRTRVRYCLNYINSNSDSTHQFQFLSIPSFDSSVVKKKEKHLDNQTYLFYVSFCKTFNCCRIPWTNISQLHKNWTRLRAVFVQNRAAFLWRLVLSQFWRKNNKQLKISWNDSMTPSRLTCFITGGISVFERISWTNDSKDKY